jgi:hypothetical protein
MPSRLELLQQALDKGKADGSSQHSVSPALAQTIQRFRSSPGGSSLLVQRILNAKAEPKAKEKQKPLSLALLSCPPNLVEVRVLLHNAARNEMSTIATFVENAVIFVLSRMWSDLIATFVIGLHPIPYCSPITGGAGFLAAACTPEADSRDQFIYAAWLIPVCGLIKHLVESTGLTKIQGYDDIPTILNFIVGWGFGGAMLTLLKEIRASHPDLCVASAPGIAPDCGLLNVGFSLAMTAVSAGVIIVIKPYTVEVECGDGAVIDWLEDLLEDIWAMVMRGATVTIMVLWNATIHDWVTLGIPDDGSSTKFHMMLFFAGFAT